MSDTSFIKKLSENINKDKRVVASKLINADPSRAALISKLINPSNTGFKTLYDSSNLSNTLNTGKISAISRTVSSRYTDTKNMLQLFPDLELAMQILVSSILSPKDMMKVELIYKLKESIFPVEMTGQVLDLLKKHLIDNYNLDDDLSLILENALFMKGSSVKAILPESLVDGIINNTFSISKEAISDLYSFTDKGEKLVRRVGILGGYTEQQSISTESLTSKKQNLSLEEGYLYARESNTFKAIDKRIEITDNIQILKLPKVVEKARSTIIKSMYGASTISQEDIATNTSNIDTILFKTTRNETKTVQVLPDSNNLPRKSIGKPLVMDLPPESVIPVTLPSEPSKHLGYFVVLDETGNPVVTTNADFSAFNNMLANKANDDSMSSYLISKAKNNLVGSDQGTGITLDNIVHIYTSLVEDNLKRRLMNGIYQDTLDIANNEDVYKIMLARSLSNRYTKILYIPVEFVTYFAFDYYENGIGKSLLDNLKIITSIRAILMFARVMAHLKSSINITTVNLTLDEHDPDPQRTVEIAIHEVLRMRQQYFPLGINSPTDLVDWVQRAGVEFSFEGHPGLPNTKFDFDIKNMQHTIPPSDFEEELRKQTYMALGLSPETVDNGFNSEFATTVVANNILLSKRVMIYQNKYTHMFTEYITKILTFDAEIIKKIKETLLVDIDTIKKFTPEEVLSQHKDDASLLNYLIQSFIQNLVVELPKSDETTLDTQVTAFDAYSEALDKVLDSWISTEVANSSLVGNISEHIDVLKPIVKAYYIRRWMAENNFLPEINELVTTDEQGDPHVDLYDISKSHITSLMKSAFKLIKTMQKNKETMDSNLDAIGAEEPEPSEDTSSSDEGEGTGGEGDDMGGFDFDETSEEEPVPEEPAEEEPKEDKPEEEPTDKEPKEEPTEPEKTEETK